MLLCSEILQSMRQLDNADKIFQGITTKLLNLIQVGHIAIYELDGFIDNHNGMSPSGNIVAEAIAPNCESCTQEQIENILREEYQWGQDITEQIIHFYTTGVSRCEINLAEMFAGKAYLLVPIVLSENDQNNALWGFLTVHQYSGLNGEDFGNWDADDVLILQQIAIQIEMWIFKDNALVSYQQVEAAAKNITEQLLCTLEELRLSNEELTSLHQEAEQEKFRFQNLFNVDPDGYFVTDSSGTILEANQPLLDMLEILYDYILGKPFVTFIARQHIEIFYNQLNYLSSPDYIKTSWEITLIPLQSDPFPAEIIVTKNINPVTNQVQFCWVVRNISDRKAIEQALQKSESLLAEAQRVAQLGNWEWNVSSNESTWSQELFHVFERDPALGSPSYEEVLLLYIAEDREAHAQAVQQAITTGVSYHLELRCQQPDGSYRYIEVFGHAEHDECGKVSRLYGTAQNISDRKLAEVVKSAEASNKAKTEFLSVMSHELRTPMNAMIGMTEILQRTSLSRQQQQYVNTILQGGEVLLSVINNILDFSRIESGHFELEEKPFRLHHCIEEVLELMASRSAEKHIELIAFVSPDMPQQLKGDYIRLRQILVNLVGNAIKFTESGEIVIAVNSQLIDRETNTYELQFEVRDTGIGIAPEAIARLFKAFSQADNSIAGQYGGTGLGLAICKHLCELMGGEIAVSSNFGEGSTFGFSIRVQSIIEDLDAANAIAPELKGKRILCVNTSSTLQQAIALYAQPWGMNIQAAYTATEALQLLTTFDFEAVLIDRQLVENDGSEIDVLELAKSIQEIFPDLHLILLTPINGVLNENNNFSCFKDFIIKPVSTPKLYQAFLNVFTNQKSTTFFPQNPQPSCETDNIVGDENFAKCYPFQILIVEDNPVNQRILLLMLENLGYQADVVDNGQKAVNNFLSRSYDLIFMDIQMPIMSGLDATKSIRQTPNHQPWIIGLSANAFSESRDSALNAGMDDYLTKPLQIKSLIAALQRIPQQQNIVVDHSQHHIDLSTIKNLEDLLGAEDFDKLIDIYLEHSAQTIARMKESFRKKDFTAIASENHDLKGGCGAFGAIQLSRSCQALQSICKEMIEAKEYAHEDVTKIASLLNNVEEQYNYVHQILQSREFNH